MSSQQSADPSLASLVSEIRNGSTSQPSADPAARTETLMEETAEMLFGDDMPTIDDGLVKQSLSELVVMLVGLRSADAHGKGIMEDIGRFFGTQLSPGTVYPTLHELEAEGVLEMRELVQTKEYTVGDREAAQEALREAMGQHLALGLFFQRAIEEFDADDVEN